MPSFDIVKHVDATNTFRAKSIIGAFDIDVTHIDEHFKGNIDIDNKDWNIGLIVGGSGTGKTTIAKEVFGDCIFNGFEKHGGAVVDDMPKERSLNEIELAFTSVGFASPPSWLKPYSVLSNGEKMRVDLAYCILKGEDVFAFDEFTSVVNREVAKTASVAVQKAVRRAGKRFIAISCHDDIADWLQPDWIYNTDEKRFFFAKSGGKDHQLGSTYTKYGTRIRNKYGKCLDAITI